MSSPHPCRPSSRTLYLLLFTSSLVAAACGGDDGEDGDDGDSPAADAAPPADTAPGTDAPTELPTVFGGDRPATLVVPASYDPAAPAATPLVVALHGFGDSNSYVTEIFGLEAQAASAGFFLIAPSGKKNSAGKYFWNATDACCNFDGDPVDDVAYLTGLIDEISAVYSVDPKRVYVVGHSNGGFMAHRMACDAAGRVAAIVSVAGATFADDADCTPSEPVSVLQIHGTTDETIAYAGGTINVQGMARSYPSAEGTRARWAADDGCATTTAAGAAIDLTGNATAETEVLRSEGCPSGRAVELWSVTNGKHVLIFKSGKPLWDFLAAHPKP